MRTNILLLSLLAFFASAENTDIEEILNENESNFSLSEKSQDKVNDLSTEKDSLLAEWKVVVKQVEGLKIYNEQKRRQIKAQEERLATIAEQTKEIVVINLNNNSSLNTISVLKSLSWFIPRLPSTYVIEPCTLKP